MRSSACLLPRAQRRNLVSLEQLRCHCQSLSGNLSKRRIVPLLPLLVSCNFIIFHLSNLQVHFNSKGKKKEKEALKRSEPTLYSYFEEVWGIRNRHMVKDLTHPYVFMLLSCKAKDRPHPRGEENGNSDDGNTWFPGSPLLSYFPIPIADPKRPWGSGACEQCGDKCAGHYLCLEEHHDFYQTHGSLVIAGTDQKKP